MQENTIPLIVVAGPTASGKTALAIALAKRCNGEVISADSLQIYREIPIATACPSMMERDGVVHHLLGCVPLAQAYSVAQYAKAAREVIAEVHARGKQPILCGGTGLYIAAVTDNVQYEEQDDAANAAVRARWEAVWEREGAKAVWERLNAVDPELAQKLHVNDRGRILRGLEVFELKGEPLSVLQKRQKAQPSPYRTTMITLDFRDRQTLYDRIDRRVDVMVENGLLEETAAVLRLHAPTAEQAIGCKELRPYFDGDRSLAQALEDMKRRSRQYAKRQLSWFRRLTQAHTLYVDDYPCAEALIDAATACIM